MRIIFQFLIVSCLISCSAPRPFEKEVLIKDKFFKGQVKLQHIEKLGKYRLSISNTLTGKTDLIYTPYEVFQMETGDINHDGKTDICLGIIKPTPFDSVLKKRLFLFQIDRDYIRPLWLSSRLAGPLEAFTVSTDSTGKCIINTLEKQFRDLYCRRTYRWNSFGMNYINTPQDSITHDEARLFFKHD
jgi:hypothetical protein